jgi:hypothetical protein
MLVSIEFEFEFEFGIEVTTPVPLLAEIALGLPFFAPTSVCMIIHYAVEVNAPAPGFPSYVFGNPRFLEPLLLPYGYQAPLLPLPFTLCWPGCNNH